MHRLSVAFSIALVAGCGLVQTNPIDFRTYPLRGVSYDEGQQIVREVARSFLVERFGGVNITWDDVQHNLDVEPIYLGERRLRLYVRLLRADDGIDVEMLALVEHLQSATSPKQLWGRPMMDVPLEEMLHQAMLAAVLDRPGGPR